MSSSTEASPDFEEAKRSIDAVFTQNMNNLDVGAIVWASAKRDIFWPAKVVEPQDNDNGKQKGLVASVHFLVEDSYENIKSQQKIFPWNCSHQEEFIRKGRALKNDQRKLEFNKAVAVADEETNTGSKSIMRAKRKAYSEDVNSCQDSSSASSNSRKRQNCAKQYNSSLSVRSTRNQLSEKLDSNHETMINDNQSELPNHGSKNLTEEMVTAASSHNELSCESNCGVTSEIDDVKTNEVPRGRKSSRRLSCRITPVQERARTAKNLKKRRNSVQEETRHSFVEAKPDSYCGFLLCKDMGSSQRLLSTAEPESESVVPKNAAEDTQSVESSDDDLLVQPFSSREEISEFRVGDIVWAKYYREPYWPSVVKKVVTKRKNDKKYSVQFLSWSSTLFKIQPKKLTHYACNSTQRAAFLNAEFKDSAMKESFLEACKIAEEKLNRKGLGKGEEEENQEEEEDEEVEDEEEGEDKDNEKMEKESLDVVQIEPETRRKRPEVQRRKSGRVNKKVSKYKEILPYISQAKPFLKQIYEGKKPCERHKIYMSGTSRDKKNLKRKSGFGPIGEETLQEDILKLLLDFYKDVRGNREIMDVSYVSEVWLPEAIIWAIKEVEGVNRAVAEKVYMNGSECADEVESLKSQWRRRTLDLKKEKLD